jgi:acyl carrier protein
MVVVPDGLAFSTFSRQFSGMQGQPDGFKPLSHHAGLSKRQGYRIDSCNARFNADICRGYEEEPMSSSPQLGQSRRLTPPISAAQIREVLTGLDTVIDMQKLTDTTRFMDVGADSLDFFNIIAGIQNACDLTIPDCDIEQVTTIQGLVLYLNQKLA